MIGYENTQYKLMNLINNIYNRIKNGYCDLEEMDEIYNKLIGHSDADYLNEND